MMQKEPAPWEVIAILRVSSIGPKPIFDATRQIIGFSIKIAACLHAGIPLKGRTNQTSQPGFLHAHALM